MKAVERQMHQRVLVTWETILRKLERIGPESDTPAELDAYGEVKDYILGRIEVRQRLLRVVS